MKSVTFTFGRFNPPTKGHMKVVEKLEEQNTDDYMIFLSHTYKPPKDPLPYNKKVEWFKKSLEPNKRDYLVEGEYRTIMDIAMYLYNKKYDKIIMIVGEDRVKAFEKMLKDYNGKEAKHGYYEFEDIEVKIAGKRIEGSNSIEGISATKAKDAVKENNFQKFKELISDQLTEKEKLEMFQDVKNEMGIKESFTLHDIKNAFTELLRG